MCYGVSLSQLHHLTIDLLTFWQKNAWSLFLVLKMNRRVIVPRPVKVESLMICGWLFVSISNEDLTVLCTASE